MKIQMIRMAIFLILGIALLAPTGCRSKKTVEPKSVPIETQTPTVSVPAPTEDFLVERSNEDGIDWTDLDEVNRIAASRGWLRDAFFSYDSSALTEDGRNALAASAGWLNENSKYSVLVEGHCDERGTEQYNLALGERRSHVAREYIQSLGVNENRLRTISYGESRPFVEATAEPEHAQNRRAHLKISGATK